MYFRTKGAPPFLGPFSVRTVATPLQSAPERLVPQLVDNRSGQCRQQGLTIWKGSSILPPSSFIPVRSNSPVDTVRCPPNSGFSQLLFSVSVSFVFLSRNLRQLVEVRKRGSVRACLPLVFLEGVGRQVTHENTFLGQLLFSATLGTASAGTSSVNEGRPLAGSVCVPRTAVPSYGCPGLA